MYTRLEELIHPSEQWYHYGTSFQSHTHAHTHRATLIKTMTSLKSDEINWFQRAGEFTQDV